MEVGMRSNIFLFLPIIHISSHVALCCLCHYAYIYIIFDIIYCYTDTFYGKRRRRTIRKCAPQIAVQIRKEISWRMWRRHAAAESLKLLGRNCPHHTASWWFQPNWKILVKMGIFPKQGWKYKNIWNHHPDYLNLGIESIDPLILEARLSRFCFSKQLHIKWHCKGWWLCRNVSANMYYTPED